jgi:CMP-N-acetylneuraminic acid synthetase
MKHTILENSALQKSKQGEVLTRFCVKHVFTENSALYIVHSKSWFAQKIAALLGELKLPEYPQVPANIPATTPNQVKIIEEQDVM